MTAESGEEVEFLRLEFLKNSLVRGCIIDIRVFIENRSYF